MTPMEKTGIHNILIVAYFAIASSFSYLLPHLPENIATIPLCCCFSNVQMASATALKKADYN